MIALVECASRKKTPNEIALNTLLVSLTIIFLIVVVTLYPMAVYSGVHLPISTLIALTVCLIPTTIGGLLSAIGIAPAWIAWRDSMSSPFPARLLKSAATWTP